MKLLQLHCDKVEYEAKTKAFKTAPDLGPTEGGKHSFENCLLVLTSIEEGDNEEVVKQAATQIQKHFGEVKASNVLVYPYAHLSANLAKPTDAVRLLGALFSAVKTFDPKASKSVFGWYKQFVFACKGHPMAELSKTIGAGGMAGPGSHGKVTMVNRPDGKNVAVEQVASITTVAGDKEAKHEEHESKSLKLESQAKSKYYILNVDGKLVEAEKFDFTGQADLKVFADYEIHKARAYAQEPPHIRLMKEHNLVNYEPASDSGHFRWLPKGQLMKKLLERHVTNVVVDYGALQVETPIMYSYDHPALKKYLDRFPARQYTVKSDEKEFFLRFAACFGQFLTAHDMTITYKDLPLKIFEMTHYSFRREQSGELAGLKRLRAFSMPDMHTLCADLEQAKVEFERQYELCVAWNQDLGLPFETAFRAQTDFYNENKEFYSRMVRRVGKPMLLEMYDVRYAYFITKFEMNFIDNAGKASGMSTVQIDVENCETFDLNYIDSDGKKKRPAGILHCSVPGAVERVVYAILEREAKHIAQGKTPSFPLWLSPTQVRLAPITDAQNEYCEKVLAELKKLNVRVDVDDSGETLQKKVRNAEKEWVPFVAVAGEKEVASGKLMVRVRATGKQELLTPSELAALVHNETMGKPFDRLSLPDHLSRRPLFA